MLDICIVTYSSATRDLARLRDEITLHTPIPHAVHVFDNTGNKLNMAMAKNDLALGGARNFIAFLAPDVHLERGWAGQMINVLEMRGDIGCVVPRYLSKVTKESYADEELKDRMAFNAVMMRRVTWKALCGFDERFRYYGADADFRKRIGVVGRLDTAISRDVSIAHERAAVILKGAMDAGLDLSRERVHKQEIVNGLSDGSMKYWHNLTGEERSAVRQNAKYKIQ
jgi:hypothetical protein